MSLLQKRLANPKPVDPELIKPRKDHTLCVHYAPVKFLPCMLYTLKNNPKLSIVRAMNYARTLSAQLHTMKIVTLINIFEKDRVGGISALSFYGRVKPSTFKLYSYWYSRFLFHVSQFKYDNDSYKYVNQIDLKLLERYFWSECRRGLKPETVEGILSAIKHFLKPFRNLFARFLFSDKYEIESLFKLLFNTFGRPRKKKIQITFFILSKILPFIRFEVIIDVRDWTVLIIAHIGGMRGGESAPVKFQDIELDEYVDKFTGRLTDIIIIFLDKTKTVGLEKGVVITISVPRDSLAAFNPIYLLKHYMDMLYDLEYTGDYLFPYLTKKDLNSGKHIKTRTMTTQTKDLWKRAGGNPDEISIHGARGGMVEDAISRGIPETLVQKHGRWKSQCWRSYFHDEAYAHACVSSQLMKASNEFNTGKVSAKHKELLTYLSKKL